MFETACFFYQEKLLLPGILHERFGQKYNKDGKFFEADDEEWEYSYRSKYFYHGEWKTSPDRSKIYLPWKEAPDNVIATQRLREPSWSSSLWHFWDKKIVHFYGFGEFRVYDTEAEVLTIYSTNVSKTETVKEYESVKDSKTFTLQYKTWTFPENSKSKFSIVLGNTLVNVGSSVTETKILLLDLNTTTYRRYKLPFDLKNAVYEPLTQNSLCVWKDLKQQGVEMPVNERLQKICQLVWDGKELMYEIDDVFTEAIIDLPVSSAGEAGCKRKHPDGGSE